MTGLRGRCIVGRDAQVVATSVRRVGGDAESPSDLRVRHRAEQLVGLRVPSVPVGRGNTTSLTFGANQSDVHVELRGEFLVGLFPQLSRKVTRQADFLRATQRGCLRYDFLFCRLLRGSFLGGFFGRHLFGGGFH